MPEPGFDHGSTAGEFSVLTARLHMLYVVYTFKLINCSPKHLQIAWIMLQLTSNKNISELFAGKYCDLYNSVSFNDDELEGILNENACDVQVKCTDDIVTVILDNYIHTHSIYIELVSNAISHLNFDQK